MKFALVIIAIVVFSAVYVLIRGMYKRDETSKDQSRIGWGETGESGSDGGSDE
ncbi:MAG: hypothetical protein WBC22_03290 [Sedimentisphaerales bacterium]